MITRAPGRRFFSAEITSRPLPSPSRMSTTAKAGGAASTCSRPSATVSAGVTEKPRVSIARARRGGGWLGEGLAVFDDQQGAVSGKFRGRYISHGGAPVGPAGGRRRPFPLGRQRKPRLKAAWRIKSR